MFGRKILFSWRVVPNNCLKLAALWACAICAMGLAHEALALYPELLTSKRGILSAIDLPAFRHNILEGHLQPIWLTGVYISLFLYFVLFLLVPRFRPRFADADEEHAIGSTSYLFPSVVMIVALASCYDLHTFIAPPLPPQENIRGFFNITALRFKLFASGPIPYMIAGTFFFGIGCVWHVFGKKYRPIASSLRLLTESSEHSEEGYYGERLRRLRLRYIIDQDLPSVISLRDDILQVDEEDFALSLVAVTWCEWALPMLGFLGTVIGIGVALGSIQEAVKILFESSAQVTSLNQQVLGSFNQGFRNMAVAFDTTFLGLMGLLILGLAHTSLKKRIAEKLAFARRRFSEEVASFSPENPVTAAVGGLQALTAAGFETLIDADERATTFRENTQGMVERVILEDDRFLSIRHVLFKPSVEFQEVGKGLMNRVRDGVTKELKTDKWKFLSLGSICSPCSRFAAIVRPTQSGAHSDKVFFFDVAGSAKQTVLDAGMQITKIFAASTSRSFAGLNDDNHLVIIPSEMPDEPVVFSKVFKADESIIPFRLNKQEVVVSLQRVMHAADIYVHDLSNAEDPEHLCRLPEESEWSLITAHALSSTLFVLGRAQDGSQNEIFHIAVQKQRDTALAGKQDAPDIAEKGLSARTERIPLTFQPKQAIPVARDAVVISDAKGDLHYWDASRVSTIKLNHKSWASVPETTLWGGYNGWLAIAKRSRLTMWRIRRGGFLYPYEQNLDGFNIDGVDNYENLLVTSDGRYIAAIVGQQDLVAWAFPQYALDTF